MSSQKGSRYERKLVAAAKQYGYAYTRIPASGSATAEDRPDIILGHRARGHILGLELKMTSSGSANYTQAEVEALERWCTRFGATPLLAARFTRDRTYYLVPPTYANETPKGNYSIIQREIPEDWPWRIHEDHPQPGGIRAEFPGDEECMTRHRLEDYHGAYGGDD